MEIDEVGTDGDCLQQRRWRQLTRGECGRHGRLIAGEETWESRHLPPTLESCSWHQVQVHYQVCILLWEKS